MVSSLKPIPYFPHHINKLHDAAWRKIEILQRANPTESWSHQDNIDLFMAIMNTLRPR